MILKIMSMYKTGSADDINDSISTAEKENYFYFY